MARLPAVKSLSRPIRRPKHLKAEGSYNDMLVKLIAAAKEASGNTYNPYSKYGVGAAVLTFDGRIFTGCNIESCAYTPTKHAEDVAPSSAIAQGAMRDAIAQGLSPKQFMVALAVFDPQDPLNPWPCLQCRQFLLEYGLDLHIVGPGPEEGTIQLKTLKSLCPHAFVPEMVLPHAHKD